MFSTAPTRHTARRRTHTCSLCCTPVSIGQRYNRWRYFGEEGASTVLVHPDCYALWVELNGYAEWADGDLRWSADLLDDTTLVEKAAKAKDVTVGAIWLTWFNGRKPSVGSS